jgi:hypothetical protein
MTGPSEAPPKPRRPRQLVALATLAALIVAYGVQAYFATFGYTLCRMSGPGR